VTFDDKIHPAPALGGIMAYGSSINTPSNKFLRMFCTDRTGFPLKLVSMPAEKPTCQSTGTRIGGTETAYIGRISWYLGILILTGSQDRP
jgi:hypothetical protein